MMFLVKYPYEVINRDVDAYELGGSVARHMFE